MKNKPATLPKQQKQKKKLSMPKKGPHLLSSHPWKVVLVGEPCALNSS